MMAKYEVTDDKTVSLISYLVTGMVNGHMVTITVGQVLKNQKSNN